MLPQLPASGLAALLAARTILSIQWNGMLPLLPVFGAQLGVPTSTMGTLLAAAYGSLAIGMLATGRLADQAWFGRRSLLVVGVLNAASVCLIGHAGSQQGLLVTMLMAGFLQGAAIASVSAIAGKTAQRDARARVFTLLSIPIGFGAFLGGMFTGPTADAWGFPTMFLVLSIASTLLPLTCVFMPASISPIQMRRLGTRPPEAQKRWNRSLVVLLAANTLALIGRVGGRIGTPIVMHQLGYSASWISTTAALASLSSLPLLYGLSKLSKHDHNARLLRACYVLGGTGLALLAMANKRYHFLIASMALAFLAYSSTALGSAQAANVVPSRLLGRSVAAFQCTPSIAGITGSLTVGYALAHLGSPTAFAIMAALVFLALALLWAAFRPRSPAHIVDSRRNAP